MNLMHDIGATLPGLELHQWVLQIFVMMVTVAIIPRLRITSIFGAFLIVVALVFINSTVWSTALFFELPNALSVQATLLLISNGIIFWILVKVLPGIEVDGFLPAVAAPIVFTLVTIAVQTLPDIQWTNGPGLVNQVIEGFRDRFQGGAFKKY